MTLCDPWERQLERAEAKHALLRAVGLCVLLLSSATAWAAPAVTVLQDRILTGGANQEFVPRFATYLPNSLLVPVGETVTLASSVEFDAIEVAGTLRCGGSIVIRVIHLTIIPGGTYEDGQGCEIVFRDVPIDTSKDPYQLGNGLINFGTLRLTGPRTVQPFTQAMADIAAGATVIPMEVPPSWEIGDELFIPDMRQMESKYTDTRPRRDGPFVIASLTADSITLSQPLVFARLSMRDPDGVVKHRPFVANLTRALVIRSENPSGTRGHVINAGATASWDVQGVRFSDLGRTKNDNRNNAVADASGVVTQIGTNQTGRYAFHMHHAQGFGSRLAGSVLVDTLGISTWAVAIHNTHDTLVEDNIALGFAGSGFVFEDGYEVRNVLRRNFAAGMVGNGVLTAEKNVDGGFKTTCFGCEGSGFWIGAPRNSVDDNVSINNAVGLQLFFRPDNRPRGGMTPSVPGGPLDTFLVTEGALTTSVNNNRGLANSLYGLETWDTRAGLGPFATNVHVAYNGFAQVIVGSFDDIELRNVFAYAQGGQTQGIATNSAYNFTVRLDGGEVRGTRLGLGDARYLFEVSNMTLQNSRSINHGGAGAIQTTLTNVRFLPFNGSDEFVMFRDGSVWRGVGPFPEEPTPGLRYTYITDGAPPPPPPPTEVCGDGIDNDGDGLVDEGCVITPPPPPPPVETAPLLTLVASTTAATVGESYTLTVATRDGHVVALDGVYPFMTLGTMTCDGDQALATTTCTKTVTIAASVAGARVHTVTWMNRAGVAQPPVSVSVTVTVPPPCTAGATADVSVSGKRYRVTVTEACVPSVVGPL